LADSVDDFVDGAIAAGSNDHFITVGHRLCGQLFGVARPLRRRQRDEAIGLGIEELADAP
jgi:hypothetical protein